jgi:hypothetical protein
MIEKYIKELEQLGWVYNEDYSMIDYYVFERTDEILAIDNDKMKITYDNFDEDALNSITYETLKIVMKFFKIKK